MLHDRELAREFLAPLQAAHLETAQITVASPEGQGWRSKLAEKKRVKAAAASHHVLEVGEASVESDSHGKFDIEAEVKARMKALESTTRAQVHAQVLRDEIHHNDKGKMGDKIVMKDKASMYDKEDNEDRGDMDDTSCVDAHADKDDKSSFNDKHGLSENDMGDEKGVNDTNNVNDEIDMTRMNSMGDTGNSDEKIGANTTSASGDKNGMVGNGATDGKDPNNMGDKGGEPATLNAMEAMLERQAARFEAVTAHALARMFDDKFRLIVTKQK